MEEKYIKFLKNFDKRFKNNDNLILCSKTLSDGGQSVHKMYYKNGNGQIMFLRHEQDGKPHGLSATYNRDGTIERATCYRNREETEMSFCEE